MLQRSTLSLVESDLSTQGLHAMPEKEAHNRLVLNQLFGGHIEEFIEGGGRTLSGGMSSVICAG